MSTWLGSRITNRGLELIAQTQTGDAITFTRIGIGSGTLGALDPAALTDLLRIKAQAPIVSARPLSNGAFEIQCVIESQNVTEDFFWQETGIYAKGRDGTEVLYGYSWGPREEASWVTRESADALVLTIPIYIGNAQNVTASIDQSAVYVLQSEGQAIRQALDTLDETKLATANVLNDLTATAAGYALDARQGKALNDKIAAKLGWVLLWSGSWGAAGSAALTIPDINKYSLLAFNAGCTALVRLSTYMYPYMIYSTGSGCGIRAYDIGHASGVLTLRSAKQIAITNTSTTAADLTLNNITHILGVL